MSTWVKLFTNFFSHRKTIRLRGQLGNDALWIPPRLWAYAAENQPDGSFAAYTDGELAVAIGYTGDASSMLQALLQAGFLDQDRSIHGWLEHNAFHQVNSERASKAARARWQKSPPGPPKSKEEIRGDKQASPSIAPSIDASSTASRSNLDLVFPTALDVPEFRSLFAEWVTFRRQKAKVVHPRQFFQKQLDCQLSGLSAAEAAACVQGSLVNQYQGLFPAKYRGKAGAAKPGGPPPLARHTSTRSLSMDEIATLKPAQ